MTAAPVPRSRAPYAWSTALLVALVLPGCGADARSGANAAGAAEPAIATDSRSDGASKALSVLRRFTAAANAGDLDRVLAVTHPRVRFDSEGRIFRGHAGIRDFIGGEVIAVGGRYRERAADLRGPRAVVEYAFRTRAGARERFTYACRSRAGRLVDCIGRYV